MLALLLGNSLRVLRERFQEAYVAATPKLAQIRALSTFEHIRNATATLLWPLSDQSHVLRRPRQSRCLARRLCSSRQRHRHPCNGALQVLLLALSY